MNRTCANKRMLRVGRAGRVTKYRTIAVLIFLIVFAVVCETPVQARDDDGAWRTSHARDDDSAWRTSHARDDDGAWRTSHAQDDDSAWRTSHAQDAPPDQITLDPYGITIEFRPDHKKVAARVAEICEETIPTLSNQLGLRSVRPFRVFLIPDMRSYQERMRIRLPSWGIAFAFMENQIMLVDVRKATNAWNSLEKVIPHELSHLLLAQRIGNIQCPLWFMEGLAQWQAHEWSIIESWRLMESVWGNRVPTLIQVSRALPADEAGARNAYRVAYAGFLHRFAEQTAELPVFLDEVVRLQDFDEAFNVYWGESQYEFSAGFARHLNKRYRSRLLIFQTGPLFTLLAFLFLFVALRIWIRNRKKLKEMEENERGLTAWDRRPRA